MEDNNLIKDTLNEAENKAAEQKLSSSNISELQRNMLDKEQNQATDEELFEEQTKSYSIITLSIIMLVSIGLMIGAWYIYNSYQAKNYDEVVIVAADDDEIKVKPADPGGMIVKNMDKDIYDNIDKNHKNNDQVEILLPLAEEPIDKKDLLLADMSPEVKKLNEVSIEETNPIDISEEDTSLTSAKPEIIKIAPEKESKKSTVIIKAPLTKATETKKSTSTIDSKKTEEYIKPVTKKESNNKPKFVQKADKSYKVQIASFKSVSDAEKSWKYMSKRYSSVLKDYQYYIVSKDIPGKGIFQRLQVGPFKSKDLAQKSCSDFKVAGMSCFVINP